jgi:hypothetical protein
VKALRWRVARRHGALNVGILRPLLAIGVEMGVFIDSDDATATNDPSEDPDPAFPSVEVA